MGHILVKELWPKLTNPENGQDGVVRASSDSQPHKGMGSSCKVSPYPSYHLGAVPSPSFTQTTTANTTEIVGYTIVTPMQQPPGGSQR